MNMRLSSNDTCCSITKTWPWWRWHGEVTHVWLTSTHHDEDGMVRWHTSDWHLLTMMKMAWWGDTRLTDIYSPWWRWHGEVTHVWLTSTHHDEDGMVRWHTSDWHLLTMMKMAWWGDTRLTDIYSPWSKCGVNTFFLVQETLIQQQKSDIVNNVAADEKNQ